MNIPKLYNTDQTHLYNFIEEQQQYMSTYKMYSNVRGQIIWYNESVIWNGSVTVTLVAQTVIKHGPSNTVA